MLFCAIIIPTLNEEAQIGNLIQSLKSDAYPHKTIIIVDGGSTDKTVEIAETNGATVIYETGEQKSLPLARNQGARHAINEYKADICCFIDGDLVLSQNFISHAMTHFNTDPKIVAVRTVANSIRDSFLMKSYSPVEDIVQLIDTQSNSPPPPAHFYRSDMFEIAGGFEPLGFREDWTFYNKVRSISKQSGGVIVLEEKCVRYGRFNSITEIFKQQEWYGRTFFPYLKYAGLKRGLRDLSILAPIFYVLGILFAIIIFIVTKNESILVFGIPFCLKSIKILFESIKYKSVYILPHFLLNSLGNYFFIAGMIKYLIGDTRLSRGVD
jgi:glycosyltransferase involved in cell wall biosynthesis